MERYCPQLPTFELTKLSVDNPSHPDYNRASSLGGYSQFVDDVVIIDRLLNRLIERKKKEQFFLVKHFFMSQPARKNDESYNGGDALFFSIYGRERERSDIAGV